jgi:hypothetical protein
MADVVALFCYVRMDQPYGVDATNRDTTVTTSVTVAHEINRRPGPGSIFAEPSAFERSL